MFLLGFAQTHILFLSWHKKSMQKNVKARRTEPTRWMCSFAERRKLAFGSDSSTFFFAHFRTSGFPSRRVGLYVLCKHKIGKCRSNPLWLPAIAWLPYYWWDNSWIVGTWWVIIGRRVSLWICQFWHIYITINTYVGFERSLNIFANIAKEWFGDNDKRLSSRKDNLFHIFTEPISYGEKE